MTTQNRKSAAPAGRFGTFAGVFTPNILTILGLILFLRVGWVVGQAGLAQALIIIAIANLISLLTGLSLSAVSTSMEVKTGGKYYMISRSLGLEIGGAIGIPLYLSQAISVAFYIIGFTEALVSVEFFQQFDPRLISTGVAIVFGVIAFVGADFAIKLQYPILVVLMASLVSFFAGGWGGELIAPTWASNYEDGQTFWTVFAIFFPAVTGIAVGASLSGDLKEPSKSIPYGTLASIAFTAVIYLGVALWFAVQLPPDVLIANNLAMQEVAVIPSLILAGVWASTLSSALGSILAAPRTLQALSFDDVVPSWMGAQMGSLTEPRAAVVITSVIAVGIIWLGELNVVAPVISMFFLNTYGMINLVAGIQHAVGNPSYRPSFKIPWYVSLLGALGCYSTMLLIDPMATIVAIVISYGIYFYLERRRVERTWGDVRSGIWFAFTRYGLLNLDRQEKHIKNWRPNIMVFTGQPHNREQLAEVAEWLSLGRGIVTFFQLIVGDFEKLAGRGVRETSRKHIRRYIKDRRMTVFAEAEIVPSFNQGATMVVQSHGIGGLESNVVLMGWSGTSAGRVSQLAFLRNCYMLHKSVMLLRYDDARGFGQYKTINIWWRGRDANANLMLLMAHLIRQHRHWRQANIRLLRVIDGPSGLEQTQKHMREQLANTRVEAEPIVIVRDYQKSFPEFVGEWSREADLTFIGVQLPEADELEQIGQRLNDLAESIGTVLMVRSEAHEDRDLLTSE